MNAPEEVAVVEFIEALLLTAPPLTGRQLDRLSSLVSGPQAETLAAA